MKRKAIAGIMLTMCLTVTLFIAFPAKSQFDGTIKIGVIGPISWIQGAGIRDAVTLAARQINDAGGVEAGGNSYKIQIITADTLRGMSDPTTATGTTAAMGLAAQGVDFVIGGFRTEAVYGAREVFMDSALATDKPIFFIDGAATNELIDDGTGSDPATVRSDYNRYRFVFRVMPVNSTMLFYSTVAYLKYVMTAKLAPILTGIPGSCAEPLKISVISENLTWADVMHTYLSSEAFWNHEAYMNMSKILRGVAWNPANMSTYGVDVVAPSRVAPTAGVATVNAALLAADAAGAKIIVHSLSGPVGTTFTTRWNALGIEALPIGINVEAADPAYWTPTFTAPEYETTLAAAGTRTPITPIATAFWDSYTAMWAVSPPTYTSYGAYDAVRAIREMIETVGKWPMGAKEMVPHIEKTLRSRSDLLGGTAMLGTFQYTGPHPMSSGTYDTYMANATHSYLDLNPTMKGTLHDVYMTSAELGPIWYPPYYTRPLVVQWQKHPVTGVGRLEVVYPISEPYSKKFKIPPWMYSHADTDISGPYGYPDGYVNIYDISIATGCWLSSPGDAAWDYYGYYLGLQVDQDGNGIINIYDIFVMAKAWCYNATAEYGQWPL